MAKRRGRKRGRSLGVRLILIIALMLMIAGFLTRRMLMPVGYRGFHRSASSRLSADDSSPSAEPASGNNATGEQLDDAERAELNRIIRKKAR